MKRLLSVFLILIMGALAFADDAHGYVEPTIGGFEIKNTYDIRMVDEVVEIWENKVKVTFHFRNQSDEKKTVTIGFPVHWYDEFGVGAEEKTIKDDKETRDAIEKYYKFKSSCNGKNLPRKLIASANYYDSFDYWFTAELTFNPGEVLEVVDEYNAGYSSGSDSIGWSWNSWNYVLTTGSSWDSTIAKATIIFHSKYKYQWKKYTAGEYSDERNYIWDIDNMTYYWGYFSYKPTSIKYDKKTKETVVTWVLLNIEPRKEWEATEYQSSIRSPDGWKQEFAYDLVKDELFKIPGYDKDSKWWLNDEYRNASETEEAYKELAKKKDFYDWVIRLYESGFTEFQPKTKVAGVYAQLLINSIYAMHGYQFKSESWNQKFSKFEWYKPTTSEIPDSEFSDKEKAMLKRLKEFR
jgi:hypothetical protein